MGLDSDKKPVSKRKTVIFFLLDASNSMNESVSHGVGLKIDGLNKAVADALDYAKTIEAGDIENRFEIAILAFGTGADGMGCEWVTREPVPLQRFNYEPIVASGWTPMARAIECLDEKMSRDAFLDTPSASGKPIVIMISDGIPCTSNQSMDAAYNDTVKAIDELNENNWFKVAFKAAVKMVDEDEMSQAALDFKKYGTIFSKFTGKEATVFDASSTAELRDVIKFVIATSSLIPKTKVRKTEEEGKNAAAAELSDQERLEEESVKKKEELEKKNKSGGFNSGNWSEDD